MGFWLVFSARRPQTPPPPWPQPSPCIPRHPATYQIICHRRGCCFYSPCPAHMMCLLAPPTPPPSRHPPGLSHQYTSTSICRKRFSLPSSLESRLDHKDMHAQVSNPFPCLLTPTPRTLTPTTASSTVAVPPSVAVSLSILSAGCSCGGAQPQPQPQPQPSHQLPIPCECQEGVSLPGRTCL